MKISVLTPAYNAGKYLSSAIENVVSQNDPNYEHIIADGGSTDNTTEILRRYPHVKWISQKDKGQSDAMNKAFDLSTGDIIVYLNADDYFENGVFQYVRECFNRNKSTDMVVGNLRVHSASGANHLVRPSILLRDALDFFSYRFPLNPVSYFYRREVQTGVGPFPVDNHYTMDYWFLLRALSRYQVEAHDKVFGHFVYSADNKSSHSSASAFSAMQTLLEFMKEQKSFHNPEEEIRRILCEQLSQLQKKHRSKLDQIAASKWWKIGRKLNVVKDL